MAIIRAYTTIEQSHKLAKILPLESADMIWDSANPYLPTIRAIPYEDSDYNNKYLNIIPAWSLAALLGIIPKIINNETLFIETSAALWHVGYRNIYTARADNPVDACVAMIEKLHGLKML